MPAKKKKTASGVKWLYEKEVGRLPITDENGNPKTKRLILRSKAIYATKQEALKAEAEHLDHYSKTGMLSPLRKISASSQVESVDMLLARWLAFLEINRSESHYQKTADRLVGFKAFHPDLGQMMVMEVDDETALSMIDSYYADQMERGKKGAQVNKVLVALRTAWNEPWNSRRGDRIRPNPWAKIDNYAVDKSAKHIPTKADVDAAIMNIGNEEFRLYAWILKKTGARPGEALALQWKDIRTDNQIVLYTSKKKGGIRTPRIVPISPALSRALWNRRKDKPDTIHVFPRSKKQDIPRTYQWAHKNQVKACEDAKVERFAPHSYRHYYASQLAASGVAITEIQRLLGHENIQTTNIYLHSLGALSDEKVATYV